MFGCKESLISSDNRTLPALTDCVQLSLFSVASLIYLVICCLPHFVALLRMKQNARPFGFFNVSKRVLLVIIFLLYCVEIVEVVRQYKDSRSPESISYIFPVLQCLLLMFILWVDVLEGMKNALNSGSLFLFWLLLCLYDGLRLWSYHHPGQAYRNASLVFSVILPFRAFLSVVMLLCSCYSEHMSEEMIISGTLKPCPESDSSFISRVTFNWLTTLIILGYRKTLTSGDLWHLNYEETSERISSKFLKRLYYYLHRSRRRSSILKVPVTEPIVKYKEPNENSNGKAAVVDPLLSNKNATSAEDKAKKNSEPFDGTLIRAIISTYYQLFLQSIFFKFCSDMLMFLGPFILKLLVKFISRPEEPMWLGYLYSVAIFLSAILQTIMLHQYFDNVFRLGMRIRSSLVAAIYRKSLVLSSCSRRVSTVGEIVNLMSVDAQKFLDLMPNINMLWSGPLQITVAIVMLFRELGPSVLAGVTVMILLLPVNAVIANATRKLQMSQMRLKDQRIKLMNEILNGIKVLKLYAWEKCFINVVNDIRDQELKVLRKSSYLSAINMFTFSCVPVLVSLVSFVVFVSSSKDNILTAEKAFVSLSLFNILRFPLMMFPMIIGGLIQASVSLKRITDFLHLPEIDASNLEHSPYMDPKSVDAATIENGNFSWDAIPKKEDESLQCKLNGDDNSDRNVMLHLNDINVAFQQGKLTAIVGPVGAGKSSLLSTLLGEMERLSGQVRIAGRLAYVPQQAWILNASFRDNILFHKNAQSADKTKLDLAVSNKNQSYSEMTLYGDTNYDRNWYKEVVHACQLEPDLEILYDGDETEIGEKGVNLSGGQKQRISLARACYSNADIYLLDDPLSAVDAHVAKNLMDQVLGEGGLLQNKTRILVTHNITILPKCDHIVVMEQGRIRLSGTYATLMTDPRFASFIATHLADLSNEHERDSDHLEDSEDLESKEKVLEEKEEILKDVEECLQRNGSLSDLTQRHLLQCKEEIRLSRMSLHSLHEKTEKDESKSTSPKKQVSQVEADVKARKLIEEEKSKQGKVELHVYITYIQSVGLLFVALIILFYLINSATNLGASLWLADWTSKASEMIETSAFVSNDTYLKGQAVNKLADERELRLGVYAVLTLSQALFVYLAAIVFANGALRSSRLLHKNLLNCVMRYGMSHFDSLPVGRLLNRFSSDIATLDLQLPLNWQMWLSTVAACLLTIVAVAIPNPLILVPIAIIIVIYFMMQRLYVSSSRQLKRLESVSRSPIFSHFGESLQGVSSIRAYNKSDKFIHISDERVDENIRAYYPSIMSNRWLAVRLETVANIIVMLAALFGVVGKDLGWDIRAGYVGLSITYAMGVTQTLNWMVRMTSELETNVVSVERIHEYSTMETEAEWDNEETKPPEEWPQHGEVVFKDYSLRYRDDLSPVLHQLNFRLAPGEKVGIVGRTGSGKSSLVMGLFRIVEPMLGSQVIIDGRDIGSLGLYDVRGRLTIIPQDPVLFSGTLRLNLDPEKKHSDDRLWEVLESANLKQFIQDSAGASGLDMVIAEGGQNLSLGQRQLLCLARALLRRSRILVLDEATAAVDLDTDQLIQKTIRVDFKESTVLTIAHRLHTVMDYDRILVLDQGRILEFDSPQNLLAIPDGVFAKMAQDARL